MSKKIENNIECIYLYMNGCGPCKSVTPIIDTMISCGVPIKKVKHSEAPDGLRRNGTPTILFYDNDQGKPVGHSLGTYQIHGLKAVKDLGFDVPDLAQYIVGEMKKHKIMK
jgi:hypothetical protein